MNLKTLIISLCVLLAILITGMIVLPRNIDETPILPNINAAGQSPAFTDEPTSTPSPTVPPATATVSATPTPQSFTGAILVPTPVFNRKAYDELYTLLGKGTITTDAFTITPRPQDRQIDITIKEPVETNVPKATAWLIANGYDLIPQANIQFITIGP